MIPILQDIRAGFFLALALAMVVLICTIAGLGMVLRPVRWSDRREYR
ncbi:MAG: hypothetical protein NNA31_13570 [Nitrospira sp.]|nr:hypothetical protein [Nitrospira sp.]